MIALRESEYVLAARALGQSQVNILVRHVLPNCMGPIVVVGTLMIAGNIPGETKVISIAIYEHVETLRYAEAHLLSAGLVAFSFVVLLVVYGLNRRSPLNVG